MNTRIYILFLILFSKPSFSQSFSFDSILSQKPILQKVKANPRKYRLQIIYTQIERDVNGKPSFKNYTYRLDEDYFYPASLVKLPCAILALEKIKKLKLYTNTIMFTDSANACQHSVKKDTTSENGYPSVQQYIKRMALVSDNFAYSRIYEFLGVDFTHKRLKELGYPDVRIVNRFDGGCKGSEHFTTNPISFYKKDLTKIVTFPQEIASGLYIHPLGKVSAGKAYLNSKNKKVNTPKDFTEMNYLPLQNVHDMLKRLIFYEFPNNPESYNMIDADRQFLIEALTMLPRESSHPTYNIKEYYDSYKKYFIYGDSKKPITDNSIKITNIVGQSYGFMSDCAYIQNIEKHVEFMLSAVIYANDDEIINDGKYEYSTVAIPFLAEIGRQIYAYELKRKKHE